jgi:meiosis-specific transcription factor NDT80
MMARGDSYPAAYSLSRGSYVSPLSSLNEFRYSQYASTPRYLDHPVDPSNTVYANPSNMLLEPSQRPPQPTIDAPPFADTDVLHTIVTSNQTIKPEIHSKIHKGFFQVDDKWTCYRRNYFSVSCSFSLRPWTPNAPLFLQLPNHATEQIRSFSMSISAVVNAQDGEVRELVQHTPKRDKQSEKRPGKITLQPQQPSSLILNHSAVGTSNHAPFGAQSHSASIQVDYGHPYTNPLQPSHPPTQHTFERIQFQKATANNGKRRAQQQYYNLVVELYAEIGHPIGMSVDDSQWVKIAKRMSHPMVVRGRSPGHYKDGRRDSSASMGPDSGTGSSGDGSRGTVLPPGIIGQTPLSHLPLMSYERRGGPPYTRNGQRQLTSADQSPLSGSPLISSSSSSTFEFTVFNDSMDPVDSVDEASHVKPYHEATFGMGAVGRRKSSSHSNPRSQLSNIDFNSQSDEQEHSENTFDETFNTMMPIFNNDQEDSSQYSKRSPGPGAITSCQPATAGYDAGCPGRPSEVPFTRFDPVQSSQSLCT